MANVNVAAPTFVMNGVNHYFLPTQMATGEVVAAVRLHLVNSGATFSITVQGKDPLAAAYLPVPYRKLALNGAVADGSLASVAITDSSIIIIPGGLDVDLNVTAITSGTVTAYVMPLQGYNGI